MICARCGKSIREGETYEMIAVAGASAVGADIYVHKRLCARPPEAERPRTYPTH
jgi:hypothetical protein